MRGLEIGTQWIGCEVLPTVRDRLCHFSYWRIGKRLMVENLADGRAEYGQRILAPLAQELEREFGNGLRLPGHYLKRQRVPRSGWGSRKNH